MRFYTLQRHYTYSYSITVDTERDPNPKDNSFITKETSTYERFQSTFAALFSYYGVVSPRVRVPSFFYISYTINDYVFHIVYYINQHTIFRTVSTSAMNRLLLR